MANAIRILRDPGLVERPGIVYELADPNVDPLETTVAYSGCNPDGQLKMCKVASDMGMNIIFDPPRNHFASNLVLCSILPDREEGNVAQGLKPDLSLLRADLARTYCARRLRLQLRRDQNITGVTENEDTTIGALYDQLQAGRGRQLTDMERLETAKILSERGFNALLIAKTLVFNHKLDIQEYVDSGDPTKLSMAKYIAWLVGDQPGAPYAKVVLEHGLIKTHFVRAVGDWAMLGYDNEGFGSLTAARLQYDPTAEDGRLPEPLL